MTVHADMSVVRTAYRTAQLMNATPKTLLALFEAGIVESQFQNLDHGADDSLGYLQQRPSQGWGTKKQIMDVAYATKSFVTKALANEKKHPKYTAGQLAQSVQISGYPDRYDKREKDAKELLASVGSGGGGTQPPPGTGPLPGDGYDLSGVTGAISGVAKQIGAFADQASKVGKLAEKAMWLAMPTNVVRVTSGALGIVLIFIGIIILGKQVKNG